MSLNDSIIDAAALEWLLLRPAIRDYGGLGHTSFRLRPKRLSHAVGKTGGWRLFASTTPTTAKN